MFKIMMAIIAALSLSACQKAEEIEPFRPTDQTTYFGEVVIKIDHRYTRRHPWPVVLNDTISIQNEPIEIEKSNLFISSVCLENSTGTTWCDSNLHLQAELQNMQEVHLRVSGIPRAEYHKAQLTISKAVINKRYFWGYDQEQTSERFQVNADFPIPLMVSQDALPSLHYYFFIGAFLEVVYNENNYRQKPELVNETFSFDHVHN